MNDFMDVARDNENIAIESMMSKYQGDNRIQINIDETSVLHYWKSQFLQMNLLAPVMFV